MSSKVIWVNPYVGDESFKDFKVVARWFIGLSNSNKLDLWSSKVDIMNIQSIEDCGVSYKLNMKDGGTINMGKKELCHY